MSWLEEREQDWTEFNLIFLHFSINDSCHLLILPVGTAMLLHQTLLDPSRKLNHRSSVREVKVINLEPRVAQEVLERRNDVAF